MDSIPQRRHRDLATLTWMFSQVPSRPWPSSRQHVEFDMASVAGWLPATVPGNVRSDLLTAGLIPDPLLSDGLESSRWTEGVDWWYRTQLPLDMQPGDRAFLEFDGIDYLSAIFVDGQQIGLHQGMFSRQIVELPSNLCERSSVQLAVRIWGSDSLPEYSTNLWQSAWARIAAKAQDSFPPFDDRLASLKAPMHSGWDFAPRLRTMGIWDLCRLVICRGVYLADLQVEAEPVAPITDPGPARLQLSLTLNSDSARIVQAEIVIAPSDDTSNILERFTLDLQVPAGSSRHQREVLLPSARLWQPWDRGQPCLYQVSIVLREAAVEGSEKSQVLDRVGVRVGVRRIQRELTGDGAPWNVVVNGHTLFLRGANWVPVDSLQGRSGLQNYGPLLQLAREAGLNFLRVWGGGGREKKLFYDLCDEMGFLVWQEFPIACVFLDHLPRDRAYLEVLRQETAGIVRALRNHPSLFLWCGGNEFSPLRNRPAIRTMAEVVATEDPERPFISASPSMGDSHNWNVWHGLAPLAAYRGEHAAFVSEFGLQAVPHIDSLRRFLPAMQLWPPGTGWERHKADLDKLTRYAQWFRDSDSRDAPADEALESFVRASQRCQAAGLQVMVEHVRRRKGQTGGLALWQWNEPWPAISWSVIDYFGQAKRAYDVLARIMQPVLVSLLFPLKPVKRGDQLTSEIWLVNDRLTELAGCRLEVFLDEKLVHEQACSVGANRASPVGKMSIAMPSTAGELRVALWQGNRRLAENVYDLRHVDGGTAPATATILRQGVDWLLR
ncbi:MAG: glycoside hydrolase family 2 TIM barrel-domain containing protein [Chloroflexota bacterium]|nr:glycoside hydrolase family 2 TIM barrel-domain containing protein [Chloroflexota bacterium]